ncbi:MAG: hypothetical protein AAF830_16525 [Pseudomonadota bacterium]
MKELKTAGIGLVVCAIVFFITIAVWPFIMGPQSTPDTAGGSVARAAHLVAEKQHYLSLWTAESLAMGILAACAFVIGFRGPAQVGSPLGWALLGVGSLANIAMYPFVMGSYFVVAEIAAENVVPYESAKAAAFAIFNIANALAFLGLAFVLLSPQTLLPRWLGVIGGVAGLVTFGGATFGLLTGEDMMIFMGPGALLGYILLGIVGVRMVFSREP